MVVFALLGAERAEEQGSESKLSADMLKAWLDEIPLLLSLVAMALLQEMMGEMGVVLLGEMGVAIRLWWLYW